MTIRWIERIRSNCRRWWRWVSQGWTIL